MKNLKRFLLSVVFATLVFATCGMSAMAATDTKTLKQNAWFTQKTDQSYTYNKITVPSDGYITITMAGNNDKSHVDIWLYDKKKSYSNGTLCTSEKTMTVKCAVSKGTYYLRGSSYDSYKYKWKFTKAVNKPNYTASKALALKANKEVVVVNTPKDTYDRWYKIKLTKKKSINYWYSGYGYVTLYDEDMEQLDTLYDEDEGCYYTRKLLPKGTYYVRVGASYYYESSLNRANLTTFKWK